MSKMNLLCIDPGKYLAGIAIGDESGLIWAGLAEAEDSPFPQFSLCRQIAEAWGEHGPASWPDLVLETPEIYPKGSRKRPNDLAPLFILCGAVAQFLEPRRLAYIAPKTWTGGVPKEVRHARLLRDAMGSDAKVISSGLAKVKKSLQHNVLDAVGIYYWASANGEKVGENTDL